MKVALVTGVKGGTGKTLVSLSLAQALKKEGRTGLLDADIESSYFAEFAGVEGELEISEKKTIKPYSWDGVQVFSTSLLIGKERAVGLPGGVRVEVLRDAILNTDWKDLDYLVIDMPAGVSDDFRLLSKIEDLVGSIIVTTPSSALSLKRAIKLHILNNIPILGVIENMVALRIEEKTYHPFGKPKAKTICEQYEIDYFGSVPLYPDMCERVNTGRWLQDEAIHNAAKAVKQAKTLGVFAKMAKKVKNIAKKEVEKLLASILINLNKTLDIGEMQDKFGYTERKPFSIIIMDSEKRRILASANLRIEGGKIKLLLHPRRVDFTIITDITTLARILVGKKRVGEKEYNYDVLDAWANGDLQVRGIGATPRLVDVAKRVFNYDLAKRVLDEFPILQKFV